MSDLTWAPSPPGPRGRRSLTLIGSVATLCQQNVLASGRISFDGTMEVQVGGGGVVTSRKYRGVVGELAKIPNTSRQSRKETRRTGRVSRQRQIEFASDSGGSGAACKAESIIESGEITIYSVWGKGNVKDSIQDCFMLLVCTGVF
jgi:hypothetical protein